MRYSLWTITLLLTFGSLSAPAQSIQQLYEESTRAYDTKDYATYLRTSAALAQLRPAMPVLLREHAAALALNGRGEEAAAVLRRIVAMNVVVELANHDFDAIRSRADFKEAEKAMRAVEQRRISNGKIAFRLPKGLLTESIVYDAKSDSFLVSCVRKRMIVRVNARGEVSEFADASSGIWGVGGMGIDAARRRLWASSSANDRAEGFDESHKGEVGLFAFDLDSGKVVAKLMPEDGDRHAFDDLTVAPDGTVYLSDGTGMLLRADAEAKALVPFVPRGKVRSAQGSALAGELLYVSDYGAAIDAIDTRTGDVIKVKMPADFPAFGIDGVAYANNSLFVVQNGVTPNRVARLWLAPGGLRVERWSILEMNHPLMDEPTIGTIAKGAYWFLAASQGNKFESKPPQLDKLHEGIVMRIPLD